MASKPPGKGFGKLSRSPPPGLARLDLSSIQGTIAVPSSLSSAATPLSDDGLALSSRRTPTELSTATSWPTPAPSPHNSSGFFSNHAIISHIPRSSTSGQISSSSKPPLSVRSSFWPLYEPGKKEKKGKIGKQSIGMSFERYYPNGYKGFLEKQSKEDGFSAKARRIFGINSFSDSAATSLFAQELMELDLKEKVFVSKAGKMRINEFIGAYAKKKLLDSLRLYDRSMSFWLQSLDAYEQYAKYMKAIFLADDKYTDIHTIFEAIPDYRDLEDSIQVAVERNAYHIIHKNLYFSFKEYSNVFCKKHCIDDLEEELHCYKKDLEKKESMLTQGGEAEHSVLKKKMKKIKQKEIILNKDITTRKKSLEKDQLNSVKDFNMEIRLSETFLEVLAELQQEEYAKIPDAIMDYCPKELPEWNFDENYEYILTISLFFLAALCRSNSKFYGASQIKNEKSIYINKTFFLEFNAIKRTGNVEEFVYFMRKRKKYYDIGLLKIVADKVLEHIFENTPIRVDRYEIIEETLEEMRRWFPDFGAEPYYNYGEGFCKALTRCIFEKTKDSLGQSVEYNLMASSGVSDPASTNRNKKH